MASLVLGAAGAFVGSFFGPVGASIGWMVGSSIGSALTQKGTEGPRLTDLKLQTSAYGQPIPKLYGTFRVAGNVIWQTDLKETKHTSGGKGGLGTPKQTTFTYSASFAILICETSFLDGTGTLVNTPIVAVRRIWEDGRLVWKDGETIGSDVELPITIYLGTEDQEPDPTIQIDKGIENTPAYRGRAYVVFTDKDMGQRNSIAFYTFEIEASGGDVGLKRYSTFNVDPDVFTNDPDPFEPYSYPFNLNGQRLGGDGNLYSYQYRSAADYGPDDHDGSFSYGYYVRTLKGEVIDTVGKPTTAFPYGNLGDQPDGFPQVFSFAVKGCMNGNVAWMTCQLLMYWGSGDTTPLVPKTHSVSGWIVNGSINKVHERATLAPLADDDFIPGLIHEIRGNFIQSRDKLFLYATGGGIDSINNPGGATFFARFPLNQRTGEYSLGADRVFEWGQDNYPGGPSGYDVMEADDGSLYVMGTVDLQNAPTLYRFDRNLKLLHRWQSAVSYPGVDGVDLDAIAGYSSFVVYKDFLIVYATGWPGHPGPTPSAVMYRMEDDDTLTFIDRLDVTSGDATSPITPIIYLGKGFAAVRDGILTFSGGDGITLGEIVADISDHMGMDAGEVNVDELTENVRGYAVTSQTSGRSAIEPLQNGFIFDAVESDLAMKFVHRIREAVTTFADDDLGVREQGEEPQSLRTISRQQDEELPRALYVKYLNVGADYEDGVQLWQRQQGRGGSRKEVTVSLPIVFSDAEAKNAADILGTLAWAERDTVELTTHRGLAIYEPTDVVFTGGLAVRLTEKAEAVNGAITFKAVRTDKATYAQAGIPGDGGSSFVDPGEPPDGDGNPGRPPGVPVPPAVPQDTELLLLDIPLLRETDAPNGFYAAVGGALRPEWKGCEIFVSHDGGTTYTSVATTSSAPDTWGTTDPSTILGDWTGGNVIDTANSVNVALAAGAGETLAGINEVAFLNGGNLCLIGDEILQFMFAELVSAGKYRLSNLLRGRYGTEWAINTHGLSERFVMLPPSVNIVSPFADIGTPLDYIAVTAGNSTDDATDPIDHEIPDNPPATPGVPAGFTSMLFAYWDWNVGGFGPYNTYEHGGIGSNGVLVIQFVAKANGQGSFTIAPFPGNLSSTTRTVSISTTAGDFSGSLPWKRSGLDVGMTFQVGGTADYQPVLTLGTTYYINICSKDAGGSSTCALSGPSCDIRVQAFRPT